MFQSNNKVKGLKCHSVIHCGFKKEGKKKATKDPAHSGWECSRITSLSLGLGLYQRHYPSLVSVTHLVVAPIIVFEGVIITGKVAREGFETSEKMRSDKDKFPACRLRSHEARPALCFWAKRSPCNLSPSSLCTSWSVPILKRNVSLTVWEKKVMRAGNAWRAIFCHRTEEELSVICSFYFYDGDLLWSPTF